MLVIHPPTDPCVVAVTGVGETGSANFISVAFLSFCPLAGGLYSHLAISSYVGEIRLLLDEMKFLLPFFPSHFTPYNLMYCEAAKARA